MDILDKLQAIANDPDAHIAVRSCAMQTIYDIEKNKAEEARLARIVRQAVREELRRISDEMSNRCDEEE